MVKDQLLTEVFKKQVEQKIAELESKTCLEFVPVIQRQSSGYRWVRAHLLWVCAFLVVAAFYELDVWWPFYLQLLLAVAAGVAGYLLSGKSFLLRRIVPKSVQKFEVEEAAKIAFLEEEVFTTRDRTGILLFISVLERAVYIFPDSGVTSKIPLERWIPLAQRLAQDFSDKNPGEGFLKALEEMNAEVVHVFPPRSSQPLNQKSNEVRER